MKNVFLQIIIPIFNSSFNLDNLFHSLDSQKFRDFHVVFVDDLSTDGTYEKLISYEENHIDTVTVLRVDRKSFGGRARNIGINYAKNNISSQYTWIIDSDDLIDDDSFSKIHSIIIKDNFYYDMYTGISESWTTPTVEPWDHILRSSKLWCHFSEVVCGNDRSWGYIQDKIIAKDKKKKLNIVIYHKLGNHTRYDLNPFTDVVSTLDLIKFEEETNIKFNYPYNLFNILNIKDSLTIKFVSNSLKDHIKYSIWIKSLYKKYSSLLLIKNGNLKYMVDSTNDIQQYSNDESKEILKDLGVLNYFIHNPKDGIKRSDITISKIPLYNSLYFDEDIS